MKATVIRKGLTDDTTSIEEVKKLLERYCLRHFQLTEQEFYENCSSERQFINRWKVIIDDLKNHNEPELAEMVRVLFITD